MMRWIVESSLKFRYLVIALAVAMMVVGGGQLSAIPVDVFPEFAPPRVEIQTACIGLSAVDVESLVTVPLEQALNGVPGLDVMRSKSVPQLSSIELIFDAGTDEIAARQLVQERLDTVLPSLPTWAAPPIMMQPVSATSRIMKIGLSSKQLSLIDMSMISYWTIRARLLRVPGVANVAIWGERIQMQVVQVDPERLRANNVSLDEVMEVTADSLDAGILRYSDGHTIGTGGFIDTPNQRLGIQHVLPITTPDDLAQIAVDEEDGKVVRLGDVADVVEEHQPLIGDAVINDGPGLMLVVEKLPWANTVDVTKGVEAALDDLRPGLPGLEMDSTIFRPASFIEMALDNLTRALLLGCLLVVLVLFAFLLEWRTALISVIAIPLSLVAAGFILYLRGGVINTMILAGFIISVGVVVDDAIIDVENITRRLRQARTEGSTRSTAAIILDGSLEVRSAIIYATLIDAAVLLPVFFMNSLSGAFFKPLALSYALAVLASMVVALTVTPALALILLAKAPLERRESPLVPWLQRGYSRVLERLIRRPGWAYGTVGLAVVLGLVIFPQLGESLFPTFKERDFLMHWISNPGTSEPEEVRIVTRASRELRTIPGVRNFGSHIGQALLGEEIAGVNFGENWISIDPAADYDKTLATIEETVAGYPGLYRDVQTYLNERIGEVLTGAGHPIVVRIIGPDLEVLRGKADEVRDVLSATEGIDDANIELQVDVPQLEVEVDLAKAQQYGLKPGDVRRAAATLVSGEEVGDIYRAGKAYDVVVWSTPQTRSSVPDIRNLRIDTPSGKAVRLADVAEVSLQPSPNAIDREGDSRRLDVSATFEGDLGGVVGELEQKLKAVRFDQGYHAEILGEWQERESAQQTLLVTAVVAGAAILLLLQASFGSWRLALLSFLTLPMALVGGVIGAFLGGGIVSLGSLVAFFTVFGIAARNGILLINHFQHLEREEGMAFGRDLVVRGARERLSPILMTSLATGLALIPLVIFGERPGQEIEHPLAIVILGGLVTSTLLNLFVTPSLYLRFGKSRKEQEPEAPATEPELQPA